MRPEPNFGGGVRTDAPQRVWWDSTHDSPRSFDSADNIRCTSLVLELDRQRACLRSRSSSVSDQWPQPARIVNHDATTTRPECGGGPTPAGEEVGIDCGTEVLQGGDPREDQGKRVE